MVIVIYLQTLDATLIPTDPEQTLVLELDELCSFVFNKNNKVWVWIALSRATREVVAYACGDHSENTCRILWDRRSSAYKKALVFTDYWKA